MSSLKFVVCLLLLPAMLGVWLVFAVCTAIALGAGNLLSGTFKLLGLPEDRSAP